LIPEKRKAAIVMQNDDRVIKNDTDIVRAEFYAWKTSSNLEAITRKLRITRKSSNLDEDQM